MDDQTLDAQAEGTTDDPDLASAPDAQPTPTPFLGAATRELRIVSLDDPTCVYGIKDEETFNRVYGPNSRFQLVK